jgi:hypothetical protein
MNTITVRELIVLLDQLKQVSEISQYGAFRDGFQGALGIIKEYAQKMEKSNA